MVEICSICGLPKDICVCGEISKEQQKIFVRREIRKWRRAMTVIEGLDPKAVDLKSLTKKMKNFCACGGTTKNGQILLQGDQRENAFNYLIQTGFIEDNIEVR